MPPRREDWEYVAPHLAKYSNKSDPAIVESLNRQRLARLFELKTLVALVGAGCSVTIGYKKWSELADEKWGLLPITKNLDNQDREDLLKKVGHPAVFELLQSGVEVTEQGKKPETFQQLVKDNFEILHEANQKKPEDPPTSPYPALVSLPIRRFVTTNYDRELEISLRRRHRKPRPIVQDDENGLADFSLAHYPTNYYSVFHCHGAIGKNEDGKDTSTKPGLVVTENDYRRWYLNDTSEGRAFRNTLDLALQANPILIVGYSASDPDLARVFRQLGTRRQGAGNVLTLLDWQDLRRTKNDTRERARIDPVEKDRQNAYLLAEQLRLSCSAIGFERDFDTDGKYAENQGLKKFLEHCLDDCRQRRSVWRQQPKGRDHFFDSEDRSRPLVLSPVTRAAVAWNDPLFDKDVLKEDRILRAIGEGVRGQRVVFVRGPFGAGKYIKVCQFVRSEYADGYDSFVFSAAGHEDIYSYLKRVVGQLESAFRVDPGEWGIIGRLRKILDQPRETPVLLVISGIERFFDSTDTDLSPQNEPKTTRRPLTPRNKLAKEFQAMLAEFSGTLAPCDGRGRLLLTTRRLPCPEESSFPIDLTKQNLHRKGWSTFPREQLGLNEQECNPLQWELGDQPAAMPLAAAYITSDPASLGREECLARILREVRSAPSERGTRVVKCVIDGLPHSEACKDLLRHLSWFRRPFQEDLIATCWEHIQPRHSGQEQVNSPYLLQLLKSVRLLEPVGRLRGKAVEYYIVSPLVKRYFRRILANRSPIDETTFGLNGYGSRGPFENPEKDLEPLQSFFGFLARRAEDAISKIDAQTSDDDRKQCSRLIRAAYDLIRGNFAANTVNRWGPYSAYLKLCTECYDLIKNFGRKTDSVWTPGASRSGRDAHLCPRGPVSSEEILWLINEIALAYYISGHMQDALAMFGLAFDWQEQLRSEDSDQAVMYGASLHCHLGMVYVHTGELSLADDQFQVAAHEALICENPDLQIRVRGMRARVQQLKGNLIAADKEYKEVIERLGEFRNLRAQCYYLRFHARLKSRLGDHAKAKELARHSLTIASSENHAGVREYARSFLARVLVEAGDDKEAIREYRVALRFAREKGMGILIADILAGMATVQLKLGDPTAALQRGIEALQIANEGLLALRQVEALTIIGRAYKQRGDSTTGQAYLRVAVEHAQRCEFRLHEEDIRRLSDANTWGDANPYTDSASPTES